MLSFFLTRSRFGCLRQKRSNKTTKLKSLLNNHNILSVCKHIEHNLNFKLKFNKNSLQKSSNRIHVKYHVYIKLQEVLTQSFVLTKDRAMCKFSLKNTGCLNLNKKLIEENKTFHRQLHTAESRSKKEGDSSVVVSNSIEHGRLNNELTKTYDQIYLGKIFFLNDNNNAKRP